MSYILEIKDEVNLEIIEAYLYYQEKRTGLGEEFLEHLDGYFERIVSNPKHFPKKRKPYREAFIKRFPFLIVYEIIKNKIIVYSVFNTWQNPEKKKK
ncbi:type II toxin-antitoxin system RelE/ParE family toxin [Flagellimonas halotolerans]|uniref:Type II toxin-antitoxin system RelE/ParE family toxin n=1 Tax=Flagellimonas halotolerans TaxID=3112164 RepID=A0ABU6IM73_9FLAO|nr:MULTISPECIES: type II toxin-antitoxin system RelE/ParE family toxin [unclassified Allomuricauda]MEC3964286.1 type II toxin-antitoxin system RelE/ParE family toxin [Muricauda sp. SYSU M86414]MEC4264156.1 type II toxin-antitoxin system RelE/ParE family toxin [Muricauda sp. SYSU M84420]